MQLAETSIRRPVFATVLSLLKQRAGLGPGAWTSGPQVVLAGHGVGGGEAVLVAMALLRLGLPPSRLALYTFGQPRVLGQEAASGLDALLRNRYLRVAHVQDAMVPTPVQAEGAVHAGTEVRGFFSLVVRIRLHGACRMSQSFFPYT